MQFLVEVGYRSTLHTKDIFLVCYFGDHSAFIVVFGGGRGSAGAAHACAVRPGVNFQRTLHVDT